MLERVKDSLDWRGSRWHDRRFQRRIVDEFTPRWHEFDAVYVHGSLELACEAARHLPTILRLPGPMAAEAAPQLRQVHVVCANGDALERLRLFMGDEVIELPIGINFETFAPGPSSVRSELGWTEKHSVMGYVGRLTRLKGVDLLAEAFLQVSATLPDARLVIIGGGEEQSRVRSLLAKEIAGGTVRMVQSLNTVDLVPWYRAMDVFVLPSRYENFSNALLEAAACGIPFIASDIGGNRILHKSGLGGLFEPSSADALARQMGEFFADAEQRRARALALSPVVRERYSWDASADRLEWILESRFSLKSRVLRRDDAAVSFR